MLDKRNKQNALVQRLVRKTQDALLGGKDDVSEEDDMGVRVGDEIHYHNTQPSQAKAGLSPLATAALAASMGLGGAGLGAVGMQYLMPDKQPTEQVKDTDTDTRGDFSLSVGKE